MATSAPGCLKGKVYEQQEPRRLVRIVGQAPLTATVYELQRLRCNLCGEVYSADTPEGVGEDESAAAMIAQLKYGTGMPFYRLEDLGENLAEVLKRRAAELPMPIQMLDALSRNAPKPIQLLVGNCLAHGRRQFVQITPIFPEPCRHVLEALGEVYYQEPTGARASAITRRTIAPSPATQPASDECLTPTAAHPAAGKQSGAELRLRQSHRLHAAALASADPFSARARRPLDNNLVERALKKAILHRKNSLFYKTLNGAEVGDLYMSLIHTCELNDVNPFDYLTELQRHATELAENPAAWMPWNYRPTLGRSGATVDSG